MLANLTFNRNYRWLFDGGGYWSFVNGSHLSEAWEGTGWSRRMLGPFGKTGQAGGRGERWRRLSLAVWGQTGGRWLQESWVCFGLTALTLRSKSNEITWRWVTWWMSQDDKDGFEGYTGLIHLFLCHNRSYNVTWWFGVTRSPCWLWSIHFDSFQKFQLTVTV